MSAYAAASLQSTWYIGAEHIDPPQILSISIVDRKKNGFSWQTAGKPVLFFWKSRFSAKKAAVFLTTALKP